MKLQLCYIFAYSTEALILWQYASNLFKSKYPKRNEGILLVCLYIGLFFVSFLKQSFLNTVAFLLFNFIFIALMYQLKWYTALFHSAIASIIMGMSELLVYSIMSHFTPVFFAPKSFSQSEYFRHFIILIVSSKIIYFLILYILSHLLKSKNESSMQHSRTSLFLVSIPAVSIFVMLTFFAICENTNLSAYLDWMISISAILMLSINLIIFAINIYTQNQNINYTEMQLLLQKEQYSSEYYKMLLHQSENQNILIHDIKKHLNSIALLNEQGERQKVADYIERIVHSSDLQDTINI